MPNSHANAQQRRQVFSEDRNLFYAIIDTPCAGTASGKETHIALAKPPFFAILGGNEYLTGDNNNRFVFAVMPIETPGSAFPDRHRRSAIMCFH
jgi:hypothetical protein